MDSRQTWRNDIDYRLVELEEGRHALFISGNHRVFLVDGGTAERLRRGPDGLTGEEGREWEAMVASGAISTVNADRLRGATAFEGADLALNINLTSICNLNCSYCFADGGDYGRIKGKLEVDSVPAIFAFIREHGERARRVRFEFFGGEPLLNVALIDEICQESRRHAAATGTRFVYRISTNLTVLPDRALELFAEHGFIVSVSIDGGRETQDRNRPNKGGNGSFDRVIGNCHQVRALGDHVTMVARMTVVGVRPSLLENVQELHATNLFDWFQIYPGVVTRERAAALEPEDAPVPQRRLPVVADRAEPPSGAGGAVMLRSFPAQFEELVRAYPTLFAPDNRFRGVLEYERLVQMMAEGLLATSFCSGGRSYFTFSPDRSIMPCHRLVGSEELASGDFERGVTGDLTAWRATVDDHPTCSRCSIRYLCGGGCKQENFIANGDLNQPNPDGCSYQLQLADAMVRSLAWLGGAYRARDRALLDDLFVSCGRPVIPNHRADPSGEHRFFRPL